MRANRWLATALLGLLLLAGCRTEDPAIAEVTTPTGEAVIISQQEFLDYFRLQTSAQPLPPEQVPEAANFFFNQLVATRLGLAEARAQGVGVDGEQVEESVRAFVGGSTYKSLEDAVKQRNLGSPDILRRYFMTEDTLTKLYAKDRLDDPGQAHVRMIAFAEGMDNPELTPEQMAAADEQNRVAAEQTYQELLQGADFATLAAERSADPRSGANGGDIGIVNDGENLPPEVRAIFQLKDYEISKPAMINGVWYIFQRLPLTLDDVAKNISDQLRSGEANPTVQQERNAFVQSFYERANAEGRIRIFMDPAQVAQADLAANPQPTAQPIPEQ